MSPPKVISTKKGSMHEPWCAPLDEPIKLFREDPAAEQQVSAGYISAEPFSSYALTVDQIYELAQHFRIPLYFNYDPVSKIFCTYQIFTDNTSSDMFRADSLIRKDLKEAPKLYGLPTYLRSDSGGYLLEFIIGKDQKTFTSDVANYKKWFFVGGYQNVKRHISASFDLSNRFKKAWSNENSFFHKEKDKGAVSNRTDSERKINLDFSREKVWEGFRLFLDWISIEDPYMWLELKEIFDSGKLVYKSLSEYESGATIPYMAYNYFEKNFELTPLSVSHLENRIWWPLVAMMFNHELAHREVLDMDIKVPPGEQILYSAFNVFYNRLMSEVDDIVDPTSLIAKVKMELIGVSPPEDEAHVHADTFINAVLYQQDYVWSGGALFVLEQYVREIDELCSGWLSSDALELSAQYFRLAMHNVTTDPAYKDLIELFQDDFDYRVACVNSACELPSPAMHKLLSLVYYDASTSRYQEAEKALGF